MYRVSVSSLDSDPTSTSECREFVRDRVVQEVPAHGRHAGDFFQARQGRRMFAVCSAREREVSER